MARITNPLTNTEIRAAKPSSKEYTLQDGGGLYLLVKPSGSKIWRFSYYRPHDKKRALVSFGSLDEVTLADARKKREEYRTLIAQGVDPQTHQQQKRDAEELRRGNTFQKVAADWYEMKKVRILPQTPLRISGAHWKNTFSRILATHRLTN